jgi:DNA-binding IclR family transcriptional regulator
MRNGEGDGRPAVGQVERMALVMDVVAGDGPVSLAVVTHYTGLPKATVHRLLHLLVTHRLVRRCGQDYLLGDRPVHWASYRHPLSRPPAREVIMPHLVELHDRVRLATAVGVLDGESVTYLEWLCDHRQTREVAPFRGLPAHATACGKALLAFDPPAVARLLSTPSLTAFTATTITTPDQLVAELCEIHGTGIAVSREALQIGLCALAVPVLVVPEHAVAAVTVAGPANRVFGIHVPAAVRTAAAAIARHARSHPAYSERTVLTG